MWHRGGRCAGELNHRHDVSRWCFASAGESTGTGFIREEPLQFVSD